MCGYLQLGSKSDIMNRSYVKKRSSMGLNNYYMGN